MQVNTSDLIDNALNWAVATCARTLGVRPATCERCKYHEERAGRDDPVYICHHPKSQHDTDYGWDTAISPAYGTHPACPISSLTPECYSTDWSLGGPIIERERIGVWPSDSIEGMWAARPDYEVYPERLPPRYGPTPLIAAMRCYVASKLGDEIEIPEGLTMLGG